MRVTHSKTIEVNEEEIAEAICLLIAQRSPGHLPKPEQIKIDRYREKLFASVAWEQTEPEPSPEPLYPLRSEVYFEQEGDHENRVYETKEYYATTGNVYGPDGKHLCRVDQLREDEKSPDNQSGAGEER